MSGKPGLPLPDWLKWLDEKFNPLAETVDKNQSTLQMHETRIAALELAVRPTEPEAPPEPNTFPLVRYFETFGDIHRWHTQVDPAATRSMTSVSLITGEGELTDSVPIYVDDADYYLYVRTMAIAKDQDAFYAGFEGRTPQRLWAPELKKYVWVKVGPETLRRGEIRVGIGPSEVGVHIDCLVVSDKEMTAEQLDEFVHAPYPSQPEIPEEPEEPTDPGDEEPAPEEPEEPEEPPVPSGFADRTHVIAPLVDERFDKNDPTLRTGEKLTSGQRHYYDAFMSAFLNPNSDSYTGAKQFARANSYHLGRHGQVIQVPALLSMARTGDARILDQLVRYWRLAYDNLRVTWDASKVSLGQKVFVNLAGAKISNGKWVLDGDRRPWSPHLKWLYDWSEASEGRGTDLNNLQNIKPWAILTQFLWALEVNRGKKSPAGFDYRAEADRWREPLRGFIDTYTSDTGEDWEDNYEGLDGGMLWDKYRSRAKPGQWPFFARGEGHAIYNSALLCFYCGLLGEQGWDIPNWREAFDGADMLMEYIRKNMVDSVDSKGKPSIIARGGGAWSPMNATYTAYLAFEQKHMQDIGRWRDLFTEEDLLRLSRSFVDMHRPDGTTLKNLAAEVDRTGHGLDVSGGSDRSVHQQVINGFCAAMFWEEGDYLFNVGTRAQNSSFGGGYETPKSHIIPATQFVTVVGV